MQSTTPAVGSGMVPTNTQPVRPRILPWKSLVLGWKKEQTPTQSEVSTDSGRSRDTSAPAKLTMRWNERTPLVSSLSSSRDPSKSLLSWNTVSTPFQPHRSLSKENSIGPNHTPFLSHRSLSKEQSDQNGSLSVSRRGSTPEIRSVLGDILQDVKEREGDAFKELTSIKHGREGNPFKEHSSIKRDEKRVSDRNNFDGADASLDGPNKVPAFTSYRTKMSNVSSTSTKASDPRSHQSDISNDVLYSTETNTSRNLLSTTETRTSASRHRDQVVATEGNIENGLGTRLRSPGHTNKLTCDATHRPSSTSPFRSLLTHETFPVREARVPISKSPPLEARRNWNRLCDTKGAAPFLSPSPPKSRYNESRWKEGGSCPVTLRTPGSETRSIAQDIIIESRDKAFLRSTPWKADEMEGSISLRSPGLTLRSPTSTLRSPVTILRSPTLTLRSPTTTLRSPTLTIRSPTTSMNPTLAPVQVDHAPFLRSCSIPTDKSWHRSTGYSDDDRIRDDLLRSTTTTTLSPRTLPPRRDEGSTNSPLSPVSMSPSHETVLRLGSSSELECATVSSKSQPSTASSVSIPPSHDCGWRRPNTEVTKTSIPKESIKISESLTNNSEWLSTMEKLLARPTALTGRFSDPTTRNESDLRPQDERTDGKNSRKKSIEGTRDKTLRDTKFDSMDGRKDEKDTAKKNITTEIRDKILRDAYLGSTDRLPSPPIARHNRRPSSLSPSDPSPDRKKRLSSDGVTSTRPHDARPSKVASSSLADPRSVSTSHDTFRSNGHGLSSLDPLSASIRFGESRPLPVRTPASVDSLSTSLCTKDHPSTTHIASRSASPLSDSSSPPIVLVTQEDLLSRSGPNWTRERSPVGLTIETHPQSQNALSPTETIESESSGTSSFSRDHTVPRPRLSRVAPPPSTIKRNTTRYTSNKISNRYVSKTSSSVQRMASEPRDTRHRLPVRRIQSSRMFDPEEESDESSTPRPQSPHGIRRSQSAAIQSRSSRSIRAHSPSRTQTTLITDLTSAPLSELIDALDPCSSDEISTDEISTELINALDPYSSDEISTDEISTTHSSTEEQRSLRYEGLRGVDSVFPKKNINSVTRKKCTNDVFYRGQQWLSNKAEWTMQQREEQDRIKHSDCTFQPLTRRSSDSSHARPSSQQIGKLCKRLSEPKKNEISPMVKELMVDQIRKEAAECTFAPDTTKSQISYLKEKVLSSRNSPAQSSRSPPFHTRSISTKKRKPIPYESYDALGASQPPFSDYSPHRSSHDRLSASQPISYRYESDFGMERTHGMMDGYKNKKDAWTRVNHDRDVTPKSGLMEPFAADTLSSKRRSLSMQQRQADSARAMPKEKRTILTKSRSEKSLEYNDKSTASNTPKVSSCHSPQRSTSARFGVPMHERFDSGAIQFYHFNGRSPPSSSQLQRSWSEKVLSHEGVQLSQSFASTAYKDNLMASQKHKDELYQQSYSSTGSVQVVPSEKITDRDKKQAVQTFLERQKRHAAVRGELMSALKVKNEPKFAPSCRKSRVKPKVVIKKNTTAPEEYSFQPTITNKAKAQNKRSTTDMSSGDMERRNAKLEEERQLLEKRRKEAEDHAATRPVRPCLRPPVPSRINSKMPVTSYCALTQAQQFSKLYDAETEKKQREADELSKCTFTPIIYTLPEFIRRQIKHLPPKENKKDEELPAFRH